MPDNGPAEVALKPCPLCGQKNPRLGPTRKDSETRALIGTIWCSKCGLTLEAVGGPVDVERRWNDRAAYAAQTAELATLRKAFKPVLHWYNGDGEECPFPEMLSDAIADLQSDRKDALQLKTITAELATAKAEAATLREQLPKWRPFETAPQDATEILAWREDMGVVSVVYTEPGDPFEGNDDVEWCWFTCRTGEDLTGDLPTLWMPYPEPSEPDQTKGGRDV